jgi:hypothetical protein
MRLLADGTFLGLSASQVALLGSGLALVYALKRWRRVTVARHAAGRGRPAATPARATVAASGERNAPRSALNVQELTVEIQALLAEVEDTARRAAAQVDNRYRKLEQLVAEADEKIRRLEALMAEARRMGQPGGAGQAVVTPAAVPAANAAMGGADLVSRLRQERGAPAAAEDPAYRPIYQLADLGKTAREIAQELGRQPGEVELILALRGRSRV